VIIKPRRISKNTPKKQENDFFIRKPRVRMDQWDDALEMWKALDESLEILPIKILQKTLKQALDDIEEKFKDDDRFDQTILTQWEQKFIERMDMLEQVSW